VIDTYDRIAPRAQLKKGSVTAQGAEDFALYRDAVKSLFLQEHVPHWETGRPLVEVPGVAEFGLEGDWNHIHLKVSHTEDKEVTFIEPMQRLGFGLAVRSALRMTSTPYVWVHQHDWTLMSAIPIEAMLDVMQASETSEVAPVKYIGLPSVRMLSYAKSNNVVSFPELRSLTALLRRDFVSVHYPDLIIPLTPLFFWFDKPHIASTAHYLERVFPTRLSLPRGSFIEDTVGHRARDQMKDGIWTKWACWLYYPEDGTKLCLKHLNGRKWKGSEYDQQVKAYWDDWKANHEEKKRAHPEQADEQDEDSDQ
jgi:hypothetical protein